MYSIFCVQQNIIQNARVAQLVERDLAKVEAAGSSPVSRSFQLMRKAFKIKTFRYFFVYTDVVYSCIQLLQCFANQFVGIFFRQRIVYVAESSGEFCMP